MRTVQKVLSYTSSVPFRSHLLLGVALRFALILYGEFHDRLFTLKYTDIDYEVFTNGSRALLRGFGSRPHFAHINGTLVQIGSEPLNGPFDAPTYRYTPLIALLLVPNLLVSFFGKFVFAALDIGCAPIQYRLLTKIGTPQRYANLSVALLWIYNPLPLIVSTRGSSESIISFLILQSLLELSQRRIATSGLLVGLAIHLKLYPVIYLPALYLYIIAASTAHLTPSKVRQHISLSARLCPNADALIFLVFSLLSFSTLTLASFWAYGRIYLDEAWIYHFTRRDTAHNFSPYFYFYKILDAYRINNSALSSISFLPQMISLLSVICFFSLRPVRPHPMRLYACLFFATYAFVSLNKVCTSQYFLWYLALFPLIAPYISISLGEAIFLFSSWLLSQGVWLFWAYLFEFQKFHVLGSVAASSVIFLCVNLCIMVRLMYRFVL